MRGREMIIEDEFGHAVCERCVVADNPLTRLRGLLGRRELRAGEGLLLRPSPSIHTWFMRFPIDAVFLDADLRVLSVVERMPAWRFAGRRGTRAVLELTAGEAARRGLAADAQLTLRPVHAPEAGDDDIGRLDVGHGIYVKLAPAAEPVADESRPPGADAAVADRRVPPLALAAGAVLAAIAVARLGATPRGLLTAVLMVVLTALAGVDIRARVLPNGIVGPAMAGVLAWQAVFAPHALLGCIVAGLVAGAVLLAPCLIQPGAIGMGDVKLAMLLGLALGADVAPALTLGFVSAVPAALVLLARRGRRATLPYGPFLALGAAVVLLA